MTSVSVKVNDAEARRALADLQRAGGDLAPAMRDIAQGLAAETELNFAVGGRPRWKALKNPPERRKGGQVLQDSGQLAASVTTDYSSNFAQIGTNKEYAAIHQFGGKTKAHTIKAVNKKALAFGGKFARQVNHPGSDIPARPYLPITADGELQPEARSEVLDTVLRHLRRAARV